MGIGDTLEYYLTEKLSVKKPKKKKLLQNVILKVRMDCEGCERKVRKALSKLKGVKSVDVNMKEQKVTVTGFIDAKKAMKAVQGTGKKAEPWPYVPHNLIAHPYVPQVYDKKAPPGFVRATEDESVATLSPREEKLSTMFSDDNPYACSIM